MRIPGLRAAAPVKQRKTRTADCRNCVLLKSFRQAGLSSSSIEAICDRMWLKRFRRRQVILMQGDRATHFYALRTGRVKLVRLNGDGRERIIGLLGSGDMFGLDALFTECYSGGAEALTDCEVCSASVLELKVLMEELPTLSFDLLRYVHHRLESAHEHLAFLGVSNAEARVAGFLLHSIEEPGSEIPEVLRDLTLEEIGGILGLTGETVCRTFGLFKSRKIIDVHPRVIQVLNVEALQSAALM